LRSVAYIKCKNEILICGTKKCLIDQDLSNGSKHLGEADQGQYIL